MKLAASWAAALVVGTGGMVLVGWALDVTALKSVLPGWVTMKANTALAFILAGAALWLLNRERSAASSRLGRLFAGGVALIGLLTTIEYACGWDLGLDQLLIHEASGALATFSPGRMALATAVNFACLGLALVLFDARSRGGRQLSSYLMLPPTVLSLLALLGYLFDQQALFRLGPFTAMALHTALVFLALSAGILLAQPKRGLVALLTDPGPGGMVARRLLPAAFLVPVAVGWLRIWGEKVGHFESAIGVTLVAVCYIIAFVVLIWWVACSLNRAAAALALRLRIANIFVTIPDAEMFNEVLKVILDVMHSPFGVFGFIDEDGALMVPTMTRQIWDKCQVPEKAIRFPRETWGNSSWCRAVREKKANYSNEVSTNTPAGHVTVTRHINVPILFQGEVIGIFEVANREMDYTEADIRTLEAIAGQVAPLLSARLQRERAQENLRKLNVDMERSNKELEQFAYVASHDLQEPLRKVASFTQLLAERYADKLDAEATEFIAFAVDGVHRMQRLINDLLAYSRVGTRGKPFAPVDCEAIFEHVVGNLELAAQESGAEVTHERLPTVTGDDLQLVQLFQNLIGNAIKFRGADPPRVHVSAARQEKEWIFRVRDNGIGIDPQYFGQLFVIFQRLHSRTAYPGTGIGLAISKRVVERHGGRIWAKSEPGKGSSFYFSIPAG